MTVEARSQQARAFHTITQPLLVLRVEMVNRAVCDAFEVTADNNEEQTLCDLSNGQCANASAVGLAPPAMPPASTSSRIYTPRKGQSGV